MSQPQSWNALSRQMLQDWLTGQMHNRSPHIYELVEPPATNEALGLFSASPFNRRRDSGIAEFVLSKRSEFYSVNATDNLVKEAIAFGRKEDPGREFEGVQAPDSQTAFQEYRSTIRPYPGATSSTSVVGPGGRMTIYNDDRSTLVSIVARTRGASHPSNWRKATDILDRIEDEIGPQPSTVSVHVTFGFFETSKYERQYWMRPAFVFVLQSKDKSEGRAPWQYTVIESATTSSMISITEGLGTWAAQ